MGDSLFSEAFVNRDYRLLGRKLKPLCLYYQFWLEYLKSPFVFGGPVKREHIVEAQIVCRLKFGQSPSSRGPIKFLQALLITPERHAPIMHAYMNDYYCPPQFWTKPEVGIEYHRGEMPDIPNKVCQLMRIGFSYEEAWMLPLGLAHWYCAGYINDKSGGLNFQTERDREFMEALSKKQQEKENAKAS